MRERTSILIAVLFVCACGGGTHAQFADRYEPGWYTPAPGQRVDDAVFNDPLVTLGAPSGDTPSAPDNTGLVTLGGFGGSLVLGFSERVLDDPCNPMGLDAIVFGNSFYVNGDPTRRFGEPGVIEIALDANGNGLPDDAWYVVRFPSLPAVPETARVTAVWDDDAGTPTPPTIAAWYPDSQSAGAYTTVGFQLGGLYAGTLVIENSDALLEDFRGLADMTPTGTLPIGTDPAAFFTFPDNPYTVGVDPGSAGGDAFDIAWAVDPMTGQPAHLSGFDFIRITTGPDAVLPLFGEVSTEVDAVSDVSARPLWFDVDESGTVNAEDLYAFGIEPADLDGDTAITERDECLLRACLRVGEIVGVR